MQTKPAGWPLEGDVETLPEIFLELHGSQWPPARGDVPQGTAEVGSWSVSRQLTGSSLPGQVRAASGHSIASGSASFAQPDGAPLSPWGRGALSLGPGGKCTLYASHAGPGIASGLRLGAFVVAPVKGSNVSSAIDLELDEDSIRLNKPFTLEWSYNAAEPTFDASWVLHQIAAQAGYAQTDIQQAGSPIQGVFGVAGQSAWAVAQKIAEATMGAVWITPAGVFTYRNRESLRGVGGYAETIEALDSLESLEWTVDPADTADRVELNYTPTEFLRAPNSITLWEATEPIRVFGGQTITIKAPISGTTDRLAAFIPAWETSIPGASNYPEGQMSRWAASASQLGGGEKPSDTAIRVSARMSRPSEVRIDITNTTGSPLWLVDGTGSPLLILRTSLLVQPGETATVDGGRVEGESVSELSVDAQGWIQDADTAQQMHSWLTSQTVRARASLPGVRVKPDLAREIGDIIRITDGHSGLRSKAIISGISLTGSDAGYQQTLDLSLLDVVFDDLDRWLAENAISTFTQLDTWLAANDINTFAQLDEWAIDFGGTL